MSMEHPYYLEFLKRFDFPKEEILERTGMSSDNYDRMMAEEKIPAEYILRLCSMMDCKVGDFVKVPQESLPVKDMLITAFFDSSAADSEVIAEAVEDFEAAGVKSLHDIPHWQSRAHLSQSLQKMRNCFQIDETAFETVYDAIFGAGSAQKLERPATPDLSMMGQAYFLDIDKAEQQIRMIKRFIRWQIEKELQSKTLEDIRALPMGNSGMNVERGWLIQPKMEYVPYFAPVALNAGGEEAYLIRLADSAVHFNNQMVFERNLPDLVEVMKESLKEIEPYYQAVLELTFRKRWSTWDSLEFWGLPNMGVIEYVYRDLIEDGIEVLSGPIGECFKYSEQALPYLKNMGSLPYEGWPEWKPAYASMLSEICDFIVRQLQISEDPLHDLIALLCRFYLPDVVKEIASVRNTWSAAPEVTLDELGLTGASYYAMKFAGLDTIAKIREQHGAKLPLDDVEHSGLNAVYGMTKQQTKEILGSVQEHWKLCFDEKGVQQMLHAAELISCGVPTLNAIMASTMPAISTMMSKSSAADKASLYMPEPLRYTSDAHRDPYDWTKKYRPLDQQDIMPRIMCYGLSDCVIEALVKMGYRDPYGILSNEALLDQTMNIHAVAPELASQIKEELKPFETGKFPAYRLQMPKL